MTQAKLFKLVESVIDGRVGYSVVKQSDEYIHVYSDNNTFTATVLSRAIKMGRCYFIGINFGFDNRSYLLFAI